MEKGTGNHSHTLANTSLPEIIIRHTRIPTLRFKQPVEYNNLQSSLKYEGRNEKTVSIIQESNGQNIREKKRNPALIRLGSNLTQYVNNDLPNHHNCLNPSILSRKQNPFPHPLDSEKKKYKFSQSNKLKRILHSVLLPPKQSQRVRYESELEQQVPNKENTIEPISKIKPKISDSVCILSRILSQPRQKLLDKWLRRGYARCNYSHRQNNHSHYIKKKSILSDSTESIETIFGPKYA